MYSRESGGNMLKHNIKIVNVILITMMALMLSGCSNRPVSEAEVKEAFLLKNELFQEYENFQLVEFEIVERRTDSKEGTDYIEFEAKSVSMPITYTINGILYYKLFDQGWMPEVMEIIEEEFIVNTEFEYENLSEIGYEEGKSYIRTKGLIQKELECTTMQFVSFEDLKVDEFEIYDRECNLREGYESIHCSLSASSDVVEYMGEYVILYERNENGQWIISDKDVILETTIPIAAQYTWEDINTLLPSIMEQTGETSLTPYKEILDLEKETHYFYYATPDYSERNGQKTVQVMLNFTPNGWKVWDRYVYVNIRYN